MRQKRTRKGDKSHKGYKKRRTKCQKRRKKNDKKLRTDENNEIKYLRKMH